MLTEDFRTVSNQFKAVRTLLRGAGLQLKTERNDDNVYKKVTLE